jgi:hypothetical protein
MIMKATRNFIFLVALIFSAGFSTQAFAQGNLQFNQVINYTLVGGTGLSFTVPAGKVWKVEAVAAENTNTPVVWLRNPANQPLATFYPASTQHSPVPYWLGSGYTGNFYLTNSASYRGSVSIIEFNVVP